MPPTKAYPMDLLLLRTPFHKNFWDAQGRYDAAPFFIMAETAGFLRDVLFFRPCAVLVAPAWEAQSAGHALGAVFDLCAGRVVTGGELSQPGRAASRLVKKALHEIPSGLAVVAPSDTLLRIANDVFRMRLPLDTFREPGSFCAFTLSDHSPPPLQRSNTPTAFAVRNTPKV